MTVYKESGKFVAKEFTFKTQSLQGKGKDEERKTLGKLQVDFAQFCSDSSDPPAQEVFLQLK